jgi:two-component sensor histidine kinase
VTEISTDSETVGLSSTIKRVLAGGGEMAALMRAKDWSSTPFGATNEWEQSLQTAVSICLTTPFVSAVHWGPDLRILYNNAYIPALAERHPAALGKPFCEVWPEIWDVLGPQIEQVLKTGQGFSTENQLLRMERHGRVEDTYWIYSFAPIYDDSGALGGVFVTAIDNTSNVLTEQLRAADAERQRRLFEQAPGFIAILSGSDHVFEFANRAFGRLIGRSDLIGQTVREALPDVEGQGFFELLDQVYGTGEPFVGAAVPLQLEPEKGAPRALVYVDFIYQPVVDAAGGVTGIFVEGYDVTARVTAESRQKLMIDEMNHRVRNTLSTVQALAMLTGKSAKTISEFKTTLSNRIHSMAKTQDLLIKGHSKPIEVCEVIETELAPYMAGEQVVLTCDAMAIEPENAVRLGLVVHELSTNAAKYGALSSPEGKLSVRCQRGPGGAVLVWREVAEKSAAAIRSGGFGSLLIERLANEMGGGAKVDVVPGGLEAMVNFALTDGD